MSTIIGCSSCNNCNDKSYCKSWKVGTALGDYGGSAIRYTADGFDCALPVSIDTYNACGFRCMYCFANFLSHDPLRKNKFSVKALSKNKLLKFLNTMDTPDLDLSTPSAGVLQRIGKMNKTKYACPVQWGALSDPFDYIERQHGRSLEMIPIFIEHNQPVRISTKGADVLLDKRYLDALAQAPELFWVAWSLITIDDGLLERIDKNTPNATARLKAMKALSKIGVQTSLRMRPIFPGISDSTPKHPKAWKELLNRAADAGARAVSMEFAFVPSVMPAHIKSMWEEMERISGYPLVSWYKDTSVHGACLRSSRAWKEDLTFAIYEETHKLGMTFAISDPHWKELNDSGCCCGILPDHPVFGGWQRQQATNAIKDAQKGKVVSAATHIPIWAPVTRLDSMIVMTGPKNAFKRATYTWQDKLRTTWNDMKGARGPLHYFEGCLRPFGRNAKTGDVEYKYSAPKRQKMKSPHFKV